MLIVRPSCIPDNWVMLGTAEELVSSGRLQNPTLFRRSSPEGVYFDCVLDKIDAACYESSTSPSRIWGPAFLAGEKFSPVAQAKLTRPVQKFGESFRDYDNRLAEYRVGMKKHQGALAETLRNEAESLGMRFVLSELKDDFRELVLSIPIEADAGQIKALEFFATNYVEAGVTVRSVVFPYK